MAQIIKPKEDLGTATDIKGLLELINLWRDNNNASQSGYYSRAWYRGQGNATYELHPGVYRKDFSERAERISPKGWPLEKKRLKLERLTLKDFRLVGSLHFDSDDRIEVYLTAQHYGMPTRLLDWTMNPLAAIFFAVAGKDDKDRDGAVFVMNPINLMPEKEFEDSSRQVFSTRHDYAKAAIGEVFWDDHNKRKPIILPLIPHKAHGRIRQQGSCFTLHMHNSVSRDNQTLARIVIPSKNKDGILRELHLLNVNQYTLYNDLDHLAKEVRRTWEITAKPFFERPLTSGIGDL